MPKSSVVRRAAVILTLCVFTFFFFRETPLPQGNSCQEKQEKQEKQENHENHENHEKHEKQEKQEKQEKENEYEHNNPRTPKTCYNPPTAQGYLQEYYSRAFIKAGFPTDLVWNYPRSIYLGAHPNVQWVRENPGEIIIGKIIRYILNEGCKNPNALVLDMGANEGGYALLASAFGCRTISFEPQDACVRKLAMGIVINGIKPFVDLRQKVVSPDPTKFFEIPDNVCFGAASYGSKLDTGKGANKVSERKPTKIKVTSQQLDDVVCGNDTVVLWHVDTEGAEFEILESGKSFLKAGKVENLILEWRPEWWSKYGKKHKDATKWVTLFKDLGYKCVGNAHMDSKGNFDKKWNFFKEYLTGRGDIWCSKTFNPASVTLPPSPK